MVSSALYKGSLEALGKLTYKEVKECFAGATMCDILQEPGMTILEAAIKSGCFKTERMTFSLQIFFSKHNFLVFLQRTQLG